jgi:glycosyltransferase involved in cell wall biosynthesis
MNKKTILIIAKDYPPSNESSGVQRILKFSQYLPQLGWDVQVLTMNVKAYGNSVNHAQLDEIPKCVLVKRAFALNTALHLSIKGRYFSWMALPDRWMSWIPFGFFSGLKMILTKRTDVLFSTYPCASAHLLGLLLHRVTGITWIADFRDPMLYKNDNVKGIQQFLYQWIERQTIKFCQHAIFTTPGAIEHYAKIKYPNYSENKWILIPNGFDEQNFIDSNLVSENAIPNTQLVLLHAGYLYQAERDPSYFFRALSTLFKEKKLNKGEIKIILRAAGNEEIYSALIKAENLESVIFLESSIPYKHALAEMLSVDGLLLFQGSLCNHQIPAKVYEYFRAKKPIFALTDETGDTASLLREATVSTIAPLNDETKIATEFFAFVTQLKQGKISLPDDAFVAKQSRKSRTEQLAALLNKVCLT